MARSGSRPKFTAATQKILCDAIKFGHSVRGACGLAGVSHVSFYKWMQKAREEPNGPHARLVTALEKARGEFEAEMVGNIRAAVKDKTRGWTPAAWLLERRLHEEWARRDPPAETPSGKRDVVLRIGVDSGTRRVEQDEGEGGGNTDAIGFVVEQSEEDGGDAD